MSFVYKCSTLQHGYFLNFFDLSNYRSQSTRKSTFKAPAIVPKTKWGEISPKYKGVFEWFRLPDTVTMYQDYPKKFYYELKNYFLNEQRNVYCSNVEGNDDIILECIDSVINNYQLNNSQI